MILPLAVVDDASAHIPQPEIPVGWKVRSWRPLQLFEQLVTTSLGKGCAIFLRSKTALIAVSGTCGLRMMSESLNTSILRRRNICTSFNR
jgi:hypothetical protein